MGENLSYEEILHILKELNSTLSQPVWLFGGVAVDFMVGRWTRPHHDIDLNTYSDYRVTLTRELNSVGLFTEDQGWLTNWAGEDGRRVLEVVFLERGPEGAGILEISAEDGVGLPGRIQTPAGYLDPNRYGVLDEVRFRVCSPAGEWLARMRGNAVAAGRGYNAKIEHDLRLLEVLLTKAECEDLTRFIRG